MFCVRCGQQLPDDANFCSKCGVAQRDEVTGVQSRENIDQGRPIFEICTILFDGTQARGGFNYPVLVASAAGSRGTYRADWCCLELGTEYDRMLQQLQSEGWEITGSESASLPGLSTRGSTALYKLRRIIGHPKAPKLAYTTKEIPFPDSVPPKQGFLKGLFRFETLEESVKRRVNEHIEQLGSDKIFGECIDTRVDERGERLLLIRTGNMEHYLPTTMWIPANAVKLVD